MNVNTEDVDSKRRIILEYIVRVMFEVNDTPNT